MTRAIYHDVSYSNACKKVMDALNGLDLLRYLCEEKSISGGKLAELLGVSRPLGVKLLSGERKLTVAHIGKLATYFKVSPNLFLV